MSDEEQLSKIRDRIDDIDQQIQDLLNARAEAAKEVARIKLALDPDAVFFLRSSKVRKATPHSQLEYHEQVITIL